MQHNWINIQYRLISPSFVVPTSPDPDDPLAALNDAQRQAVEHGVKDGDTRPLLIVAGAGSGKTNTLAHRVAHLIRHGADPARILLLTFSRRAAQEMERRAETVLAGVQRGAVSLPWSGTFHAIGARLLREYAPRIGLDEVFTIHDRGDAEDLMGLVRHELGLDSTEQRFPKKGTCLAIYSRAVNGQEPLDEVLAQFFPWCAQWEAELRRLFAAYVEAKAEQNALDYDDLLLYWAEMMGEPSLAEEVGTRFDHVMVDEYQDTNRLQARILLAMKPQGQGVTVVGDDAQSIYAFRGATIRNILDFPKQFEQLARIITLERNYRSTQGILDVSNAVIEQAKERHAKKLWTEIPTKQKPRLVLVPDEAMQARFVAEQVLNLREAGIALKSQAVLFRASAHSAPVELELMRRDMPFVKFGGLKFLEAAHVKDLLAILRLAENPKGKMAGLRVAQLIPGIGPGTAQRLMELLSTAAEPNAAIEAFQPPHQSREDWVRFAELFKSLRAPGLAWPDDTELAMRWYLPHLDRLYDNAPVRRGDNEQLQQMAKGYPSRERFLTELTLDPPEATSDRAGPPLLDDDYLILSTIHSAKGQEWTSVHVLNAVDGCIPSDMSTGSGAEIEEERRLLYVALTRAKSYLQVIMPQRFYVTQQRGVGDRHLYAGRTRFIDEATVKHFEVMGWPEVEGQGVSTSKAAQPVIQVRQRARAAWG